ncbi:MAG: polymer-forming cytoskeletal protein [Lachnospiraceae bacterium]|nr:polymer-forming cytoskeletal protein [Lachnospiraceae bacterium]
MDSQTQEEITRLNVPDNMIEEAQSRDIIEEIGGETQMKEEEIAVEAMDLMSAEPYTEDSAADSKEDTLIVDPEHLQNLGVPEMEEGPEVDETGVITAGMTITGDITSEGSLDVIGAVTGNINVRGKLNISGIIEGNSKASEIFADSAKITGELISSGAIKVGQESVILGNVSATSAVIAGAIKGNIDVHGPVILDTSAIVMGDIKSKSVQINNGAVIEGHCSQCYADVSPTSFFDEFKNAALGKRKK